MFQILSRPSVKSVIASSTCPGEARVTRSNLISLTRPHGLRRGAAAPSESPPSTPRQAGLGARSLQSRRSGWRSWFLVWRGPPGWDQPGARRLSRCERPRPLHGDQGNDPDWRRATTRTAIVNGAESAVSSFRAPSIFRVLPRLLYSSAKARPTAAPESCASQWSRNDCEDRQRSLKVLGCGW